MNAIELADVKGKNHEEYGSNLEVIRSSEPVKIVNHVSYEVPDAEYEDEFVDKFGNTITKTVIVRDGLEEIDIKSENPWEDGEVAVIMSEIMVGSLKMKKNINEGRETDWNDLPDASRLTKKKTPSSPTPTVTKTS